MIKNARLSIWIIWHRSNSPCFSMLKHNYNPKNNLKDNQRRTLKVSEKKIMKTKDKEKILKAAREKQCIT